MKLKKLFQILGPGLIYAGAAVGVSHLVQSTRAGANFGFELIWILLITNIIKYPFFEFGPRYANVTGKSLIEGYHALGKWAILAFAILTLLTMFAIQAAITVVTAGLIAYVFKLSISTILLSSILLIGIMSILMIGKYKVLDQSIKIIIILLAISTIIAVFSAFGSYVEPSFISSFNWSNKLHIFFLIAFIGWMPSPVDISVWSSLWTIEKQKQMSFKPSLKQSLLDFKIGYIGTTILALGFLSLGALVMYNSGTELSANGTIFAGQFITMYTQSIGEWSYYIIAIAAVSTMISTTLTCLDAYPRVLKSTTQLIFPKIALHKKTQSRLTIIWLFVLVSGTLFLIAYLSESMRTMVDLATTLSFVTAPILAYMNLRVVTDKHMPASDQPSKFMRIYAWAGIILLSIFTLLFLYYRFIITI